MKTYKNIYPKIWEYENLYWAWRNAARGKRRSPEVAAFEYGLTDNLLQLEAELRAQSYRPGPYRHFYIHQPKRRRISAAPFRDRVVHHAAHGNTYGLRRTLVTGQPIPRSKVAVAATLTYNEVTAQETLFHLPGSSPDPKGFLQP